MSQHKWSDYTIKRIIETNRYLVVSFQTPLLGTWSVFIPKSEIEGLRDYEKFIIIREKAVKNKIGELEHELKAREKRWKVPIRRIMGLTLYKTDIKVLLFLSLEGPCESIYELWQKRKVVAKSTSYAAIERLQSYGFVKKTLTTKGRGKKGRRKYAVKVRFLGFCAMIREGIEQIFERRDEVITKNPHVLPIIFNYWSIFEEDLRNEIWGRILEYVRSEFEDRLALLLDKYPPLTLDEMEQILILDEMEQILQYDLTRFIVFPWLYELEDSFLSSHIAPETKSKNRKRLDKVPDDVKKTVKSLKKFAKKTREKHIRDWISTLSKFETIKDFISKESDRLEKLFDQSLRTIKECSSIARNYDKLGIYSRKNH